MKSCWSVRLGSLLAGLILPGLVLDRAEGQKETDAATRQYATAVRLQNLQSYDLAAEAWEKFLADFKTDPRVAKATHYLGVCQFHDEKLDEALKTFETVVDRYPKLEMLDATYLYLGVTQYGLAQAGKRDLFSAAAKSFDTLVKKYPESKYVPDALFYRGESYYMLGKKQEAAGLYLQLVKNHPKHKLASDALYALGVAEQELKEYERAGETYEAFLEEYPESPLAGEVKLRRGETLFAAGQLSQAAKWFAAAAATEGFELADQAVVRQADALAQMKQYAEAAAVYATVPEKFPKSPQVDRAILSGGECYYLAGEYAEARQLLERLLGSGGRSGAEAAHWMAKSLLKEGRPEEALAAVEKVLPLPEGETFAAELLMDRADAVYEIADRRQESIGLYAAVAAEHPEAPVAAEALYMAAFAALELGRYETALEHAKEFLAAHADHELVPDVTHVAAESHLLLGKPSQAGELYGQLLENYPDHADADLWKVRRGFSLQLQGKYEEATSALEPVLDDLRDRELLAEARYLIGSSRLELDEYEAAVDALKASLAAAPKGRQADRALLALAGAYRQLDDLEEAKASAARLIADFPQSSLLDQAHYRLGEYSYLEGDFDAAAAEYRQVILKWPESSLAPHALHELGCTELNRDAPAAAEKVLTALVEKYPEHELIPQARYARAMARHQLEKFKPAIEDLEAVLSADGSGADASDARYLLGLCQMGLEQFDEAAATFGRLLEEDPRYAGAADAQYQLAWARKLSGDEEKAAEAFAELAKKYPESPRAAEAHYHVAELAYRNKDYEAAAAGYYTAMQKAGRSELNEKAGHKLAWSYYHQGDFDRAQKTFYYQQGAYPDSPLAADAAFMEAECLFKQDKFEEALAKYEGLEGLSNEKFQALALLHAGQAAGQLDQWQKSLKLLRRCTDQFPDSDYAPEALYEQGWAQQKLGNSDEAVALYEQVIAKTGREVAARAQFMIGEIQFESKAHSEAVKSFLKVLDGYSYPKWQAEAAYEAGRCFEVLAKKTQAVELYRELIERFPKSDKVPLAKERVEQLEE